MADRFLYADKVDMVLADEQYANGTGPLLGSSTASSTTGTTLWTLGDQLNSVRDVVDNNGTVRQHVVYDSMGKRLREVDRDSAGTVIASSSSSAIDELFSFTGRDWDADSKLQYNRARWYDPSTGRWQSQDPIGFLAGDANLYRSVGNSPTTATDPFGLWQDPVPPNKRPGVPEAERYASPETLAEMERLARARILKEAKEELRRKTLWERRLTSAPILDLLNPIGLTWQDFLDWRNDDEYSVNLRETARDPNTHIAVDPLGGWIGPIKGNICKTGNIAKLVPVKPLRYKLGPDDVDWRGAGKTAEQAIEEAFAKTGKSRSEFEVTKWGKDKYGKSQPVEWRHKDGSEVNMDWPHATDGPDAPHVGWQTGAREKMARLNEATSSVMTFPRIEVP